MMNSSSHNTFCTAVIPGDGYKICMYSEMMTRLGILAWDALNCAVLNIYSVKHTMPLMT